MKILFVGEIVAKPGRDIVQKFLPEIIKENKPDITGIKNPMYGRKHSEETKEKMRVAAKNRKSSEETKNKISNSIREWASKKDPKMLETTKLKMSKAKLGKKRGPQSEEHKRNQSEAMKLAWKRRKSLVGAEGFEPPTNGL